MKHAILKELRLINFGCFSEYSAEFASKNVLIGANGTGKTTIADAFCWLFTDKLMNGASADVRPHDENGEPLNDNDIFVTAYVEVDGAGYIFEKQVHKGIKGNETMYAVNGIQKRSKDFKAAVTDIFGVTIEQFGYCISASHFVKLPTADRKALLFSLIDIDDDEKLAGDDERFISLVSRLQVATIDECLDGCRRTLKGKGKEKGLLGKQDELALRLDEICLAENYIIESGYLRDRKKDLTMQHGAVTAQLVETEKVQDLLKQFAKYKTDLVTEKVNALFEYAEFTFTEPTLAGDPKEICDMRYKGERYGKRLNTGARVLLDMDIVKTFQKAYGLELPLFIDNAESLSSGTALMVKGEQPRQIIALFADECPLMLKNERSLA